MAGASLTLPLVAGRIGYLLRDGACRASGTARAQHGYSWAAKAAGEPAGPFRGQCIQVARHYTRGWGWWGDKSARLCIFFVLFFEVRDLRNLTLRHAAAAADHTDCGAARAHGVGKGLPKKAGCIGGVACPACAVMSMLWHHSGCASAPRFYCPPPSPGFSRLFTLLLMRARSIAPQQIRLPCSKRLDAKGRISAWLTFVCVETGKRGGVHVRGRAGQLGVTCDQITGAR